MKKTIKLVSWLLVVATLCLAFASCGKRLSGSYEVEIGSDKSNYSVTYTFSGKKVTVDKKLVLSGEVKEHDVYKGTYEIAVDDDGDMEITLDFETEADFLKRGTYTLEEGEDYIMIGLTKYTKKA